MEVLESMHHHLHIVFKADCSPVLASPVYLHWLPQVFGEQDDRWLDALLCVLDIFVHTRSL